MRRGIIILSLLLFAGTSISGQNSSELLREGDKAYQSSDFSNAELSYRKARQEESTLQSNYNLGNATYKQERYEEAVEHYLNATRKTDSDLSASDTYYNLGNAYFNAQKVEEAIEAYKQAIRLNPENEQAKYNLTYLKELLKMQQQQEQQQQQNQDQQNDENQDQENQEQENQEQQEQDQQNDDQENEGEEDQDQNESEQDSTQQQDMQESSFDSTRLEKQTLDSLDAAKLLQIIQDEERKVQEKLRKFNSKRKKPDKDW